MVIQREGGAHFGKKRRDHRDDAPVVVVVVMASTHAFLGAAFYDPPPPNVGLARARATTRTLQTPPPLQSHLQQVIMVMFLVKKCSLYI